MQEVYSHTDLDSIILSLLKKYHAEKAILFGSYARKEADEKSDIDLMIVGGPAFDPTDVFSLAEDLHRRTGKSVDVYEQCEINQESDFYQTILRERGEHRGMKYTDEQRIEKMTMEVSRNETSIVYV